MRQWGSIDEVLEFAIENEIAARAFYVQCAERSTDPRVRQAFLANADEELEHRRKLEAVKAGEKALVPGKHVVDLKVADFVVAVEGSVSDLDFHDALVLSMKREKAAFRLYTALAALTEGELRQTFLGLAAEEAQHKLCFELQYDREFRQEE